MADPSGIEGEPWYRAPEDRYVPRPTRRSDVSDLVWGAIGGMAAFMLAIAGAAGMRHSGWFVLLVATGAVLAIYSLWRLAHRG